MKEPGVLENRRFSFGANWQDYLEGLSESRIQVAREDIETWLGKGALEGKRVIDIGCGSGIHSMVFHRLGARETLSFDLDENSVAATRSLWEREGKPSTWTVRCGSILDDRLVRELAEPGFDVVYSWGVLHHTGAMWDAIDHAIRLIRPGGLLMIALYVKGPHYQRDLALKTSYNRSSVFGKRIIYWRFIVRQIFKLLVYRHFDEIKKLIFPRRFEHRRGMNVYNDIIDWLGGLPYEVCSAGELVDFTRKRSLVLERLETGFEGGNNIFLFSRPKSSG